MQGHIWRTGFESNELVGEVFDDVPEALEKRHSLGTKVFSFYFPFSLNFLADVTLNFCIFPSITLWVLSYCYCTTSYVWHE